MPIPDFKIAMCWEYDAMQWDSDKQNDYQYEIQLTIDNRTSFSLSDRNAGKELTRRFATREEYDSIVSEIKSKSISGYTVKTTRHPRAGAPRGATLVHYSENEYMDIMKELADAV